MTDIFSAFDSDPTFDNAPAPQAPTAADRKKAVHLPAKDEFRIPCPSCKGRGTFYSYAGRPVGPCFKCKGKGKVTARQAGAMKAKVTRENNLATKKAEWLAANPKAWAWMVSNQETFEFARSMVESFEQWGRLTDNQLAAVNRCIAREEQRREERARKREEEQARSPVVREPINRPVVNPDDDCPF